jgi:cholesterol oxidase
LKSLAEVDHVEKAAGGYQVVYQDLRDGSQHRESAPIVVLAAGCLGSTELLLRSRPYIPLSDAVGTSFSSNGDFAGFVEVPPTSPAYPVFATKGPINTCHAMFQDGALQMTIEDSAIPPMFAAVTRAALDVLDNAAHREPFMKALRGLWLMGQTGDLDDLLPRLPHPSDPRQFQTEHEMVSNVFFFNCMGTDTTKGKFDLDPLGRLALSFDRKLADDPVFGKIEGLLRAIADKMQGQYVPFPLWDGLAQKKLVSVHPLGGCPIGNSSTDGVVNTKGEVFDARTGASSVHKGLYVLDASVIPGPLAVNPTLTIVALGLKIAAGIA